MIYQLFVLLALATLINAKIYFQEDFNDKDWKSRWVVPSDWKPKVITHELIPHIM